MKAGRPCNHRIDSDAAEMLGGGTVGEIAERWQLPYATVYAWLVRRKRLPLWLRIHFKDPELNGLSLAELANLLA